MARAFGVKPVWLTLEDADGSLRGGLPLGLVTSKFFGRRLAAYPCAQYCEPLTFSESETVELLGALPWCQEQMRAGVTEIKVRRMNSGSSAGPSEDWSYCTHDLDIGLPEDRLVRSFHKSCIQRPIANAKRLGLRLRVGRSESDIRCFYRLYTVMRKSKGLLPAPFGFFRSLWHTISENDNGEVLHAVCDGRIVSSIIMLYFGSMATYEYGANRIGDSILHSSQFLLWEAMKRAKSRDCTMFNLGRTGKDNPGLLQYKQRWGATLVALDTLTPGNESDRNFRDALRPMLRAAMKGLVFLMPRSVCEYSGSFLYGQTI